MISVTARRRVRERAQNRCEYCRLRQEDEPFVGYQVEYIIAIQHGGVLISDTSSK